MLIHLILVGVPFFYGYECPVHLQRYDPALGTNTYLTISRALLYDYPYTGRTYHIVIHQSVEILDLKHRLFCPIQVRTNGVALNGCPIFLTGHLTEETHAIADDD